MIGSLTIQLPMAKGSLTLSGSFNAFDLVGDERALVFALLDLMQDFEAKHKSDPITAAVHAQLDPLKRELVDVGRKACEWRCLRRPVHDSGVAKCRARGAGGQ